MDSSRRAAALGLLAYALATPVAFMAGGAPGGGYSDSMVRTYLDSGHWVPAWLFCYLGALGALGLLVFGARWRSVDGSAEDLLGRLALAAAVVSVVGWFIDGGVGVSMAEGGHAVQAGVPHSVVYLLTETGNLLAVCAPAFFMGVGAIVLATRSPMPTWLKIFSLVGGVCGILAPLFFTYGVYVLWTVIFAGWLLAGGRRTAPMAPSAHEASLV
jgi:hypothetical protein